MSDETNNHENLNDFEEALISLRPSSERLDPQFRALLAEEASLMALHSEGREEEDHSFSEMDSFLLCKDCNVHTPDRLVDACMAGVITKKPQLRPQPFSAMWWRSTRVGSVWASALVVGLALVVVLGWRVVDWRSTGGVVSRAVATEPGDPAAPSLAARDICKIKSERVGRITGLIDCRWKSAEPALTCVDHVVSGQWLRLEAGLLEITYDSGVKVLLQGPAAYEVLSDGGYLASGELVGMSIDSPVNDFDSAKNGGKSQMVGPTEVQAAPIKFRLRAPVVDIFDLGTEFGAKVDAKSGTTEVHVFEGFAALCSPIAVGQRSNFVLRAREAAVFTPTEDGLECAMRPITVAPEVFHYSVGNRIHPTGDSGMQVELLPKR